LNIIRTPPLWLLWLSNILSVSPTIYIILSIPSLNSLLWLCDIITPSTVSIIISPCICIICISLWTVWIIISPSIYVIIPSKIIIRGIIWLICYLNI
jgi:hypothetical protein